MSGGTKKKKTNFGRRLSQKFKEGGTWLAWFSVIFEKGCVEKGDKTLGRGGVLGGPNWEETLV